MNPVVILTRNNLDLTRKAIETLRNQDIGDIQIVAVDNGSEDGTVPWLQTQRDILTIINMPANSVAGAWNQALSWLFGRREPHVLVVNNDVELRPESYRSLVAGNRSGFVTLIGDNDRERVMAHQPSEEFTYRPHPDFSAYLITRDVWERVGRFDENFRMAFCEDWDYHCRLHGSGIRAECINVPYYHVGSATVKNADPQAAREIQKQAEANRKYFAEKWGFRGASREYYEFFGNNPPEAG